LKKRSKKLLLTWTVLVETPGAQFAKVFWLLFFKKVTAYLLSLGSFRLYRPAKPARYVNGPAGAGMGGWMMGYGRIGFALIGLSVFSGCARPPAPHIAAAPSLAFSLDTPVEKIAANDRGKAVLDRDLPGLMASRNYLLFDDMSLSQIATLSSGQLTKTKLDLVEADLSQIPR
jgi:hypothetical protein